VEGQKLTCVGKNCPQKNFKHIKWRRKDTKKKSQMPRNREKKSTVPREESRKEKCCTEGQEKELIGYITPYG